MLDLQYAEQPIGRYIPRRALLAIVTCSERNWSRFWLQSINADRARPLWCKTVARFLNLGLQRRQFTVTSQAVAGLALRTQDGHHAKHIDNVSRQDASAVPQDQPQTGYMLKGVSMLYHAA